MNIYKGNTRRQVGGGLFSTISRGVKPLLQSLLAKLKPHALSAGKAVGQRAAKAALNVGTDLATNFLTGRLNMNKAKDIVGGELERIKDETGNVVNTYKRKLGDVIGVQTGSGNKRRRIMPKRKAKTTTKRKAKTAAKKTYKKKRINKKQAAVKKRTNLKRVKKSINKKRTRRVNKNRVVLEDIFGK